MPVLHASAEPTSTTRAALPLPARDRPPSGTGFSSLVDDNAAAKADSAPAPKRDSNVPARAQETPRSRDGQRDDSTRSDADPAPASSAESTAPSPVKTGKGDAPAKKDASKTDGTDTSAADPVVATPIDPAAPVTADAPAVTPAAAADPVAVAVPIAVPTVPAITVAVAAAPAPLAIAAAGLAAAKAVAAAPADTVAAPTDATGEPAAADAPAAVVATAAPVVVKPVKAAKSGTDTLKIETGFGSPDVPKTDGKPAAESPTPATAAATAAPKAEAQATDAKPKDGATPDVATAPAPDGKPQTHHAATVAAPAPADVPAGNSSLVAPQSTVPITAPATATVQLTATAATAQPVPLNGLAVELAARATSGNSRFEIRLDPAELGRIDVRLDVDKQGNVTSHLTVEKPETLAMLRQDAPQLQRALSDAGFKTSDSGMQFSLGDQSQSQARQNSDGGDRRPSQHFIVRDDETAATPPVRSYGRMFAARGGVDISV